MATIRKREWTAPNGTPKSAWQVDYRDQSGARRSKQFARKKDAEAWLVGAAWQVSQGTHTADSQSVTIASAAELWIERAQREARERSTVKQYRELARLHINPLLGSVKLSRLSRPMVESFRDDLLKDRSKAMAGKAVRALSSIIHEAQKRGLVAQNVAQGVKVIRKGRERARIEIPSQRELKAILKAAGDDTRSLLLVAILTGLRSSELRGLRWSDIDLKAGTISVAQRADAWGIIGPPKSDAGYRTIPIAPALVAELKRWKLRARPSPLDLAFPNAKGGAYLHNNLVRRVIGPVMVSAGVCEPVLVKGAPKLDGDGNAVLAPRYGLHALRHAAASAWIAQRIDLKRLQTWMGHASIQMTLDVYGHLIADSDRDVELVSAAGRNLLG